MRQRRRRDARERPPRVSAPFGNAFANAGGRGQQTQTRIDATGTKPRARNERRPRRRRPAETRAIRERRRADGRPGCVVVRVRARRRDGRARRRGGARRDGVSEIGEGKQKRNASGRMLGHYDDTRPSRFLPRDRRAATRRASRLRSLRGRRRRRRRARDAQGSGPSSNPAGRARPETGAWFADDFLELDPAFSKHMDFTKKRGKGRLRKESFGGFFPRKTRTWRTPLVICSAPSWFAKQRRAKSRSSARRIDAARSRKDVGADRVGPSARSVDERPFRVRSNAFEQVGDVRCSDRRVRAADVRGHAVGCPYRRRRRRVRARRRGRLRPPATGSV